MHRTALTLATTLALLAALPVTAQQAPKRKAAQRAVPVVAVQALPPADNEQLAAAALTLFGNYACEFGKSLRVSPHPRSDGYVDLQFDKQRITLKPVLSHTGALRLEDVRGRWLLVQIATKSMVMDVKVGQRLADDCVHETQSETRRRLALLPPGPGLGLSGEPDQVAAGAAAQARDAAAAAPAASPSLPAPDVPPVPDKARLAQACASLAGMAVAASEIGLPSEAAVVQSATLVPAVTTGPQFAEYCKLLGSIAATSTGADPISFQINLPTTWNEKALMVGGGGFNGTLIDGVAPLRDAAAGQPQPITQGYATFGTDSGHNAAAYNATDPARFALNDEMFLNFAHQSYKKVKDVAHVVMRKFYLRSPARQYFYGGSEGGREALTMAQRYPADFDGIVSVVPVIHWTGLFHGFVSFQLPQFDGGALNTAKIRLLAHHVNTTCDALDGLADGVVNNYLACPSKVNIAALRCAGGADLGDACLSDAQLATLNASYGPTVLPFPLANGLTTYPGRLYGGEVQIGGDGVGRWVTNGLTPGLPPTAADARGVLYGSSYARYVIARDANFDIRTYDAAQFQQRVQEVSALMDSTNPDLAAFRARGGRLIIRENSGDWAQSPLAGIQYVQSVAARLGQTSVDDFVRLYVSPASNHGGQAASLTTAQEVPTHHDLLSTLDQWVTSGIAPADALVQVRNQTSEPFAALASRPMCRYPGHPQYVSGDTSKAESYRCAVSAP